MIESDTGFEPEDVAETRLPPKKICVPNERKQANAKHTVEGRIFSDMEMEAKTKRRILYRGSRGIVVKACGMGSYADRPVAQCPGITQQSTVKGTGDKRTWKTLMKIRDKQRENRSKSAEEGRKQVLGRRGYLSHSTAYQYRSKLNSLYIIHPEWQHSKEDIDHVLLQRRINPKVDCVMDFIRASQM